MNPEYADGPVTIYVGDCLDVMRGLPDASVDAVVTDPPYGLEFMGREWDGADGFRRSLNPADTGRDNVFGRSSRTSPEYRAGHLFEEWTETWAREAFRLLKPGGHLLAFGGTRTFHRLTAGIEDAGFEIRDSIAWLYGSGFPKSLNVSKAIDKQLGAEGTYGAPKSAAHAGWIERGRMRGEVTEGHEGWQSPWMADGAAVDRNARMYEGGTEQARDWQGWGTALKPAFEPIVVARKPLAGTVAANVLAYGTGALNIDASRIGHASEADLAASQAKNPGRTDTVTSGVYGAGRPQQRVNTAGRWPTNVILDESQAAALDQQSGERRSAGDYVKGSRGFDAETGKRGSAPFGVDGLTSATYADQGGASRFFYTAKASTDERPNVEGIAHPTVKPLDLMRWLVRLVTPKGGTVLEPFAGSGTTVEAAVLEGFRCIAIEREADYLPLIMQRIRKPHHVGLDFGDWDFEAPA